LAHSTIVILLGLASAATDTAVAIVFLALWRSDRQRHPFAFGLSFASIALTLLISSIGRWSGHPMIVAPFADFFFIASVVLQIGGCLALAQVPFSKLHLVSASVGAFLLVQAIALFGIPGIAYLPSVSGIVYGALAALLILRRRMHAKLMLLGVLYGLRAVLNLAWLPSYLAGDGGIVVQGDHVLVVTIALVLIVSDLTTARRRAEAASASLGRRTDELMAANAQLVEERSQALAANRAKSAFLANMSHELRTPLNAVIGFSDILANSRIPNAAASSGEYGQLINSAAQHLLGVINDVLDMSRIEAGKITLSPRPMNLRTVLDAVMSLIIHHARARRIGFSAQIEDSAAMLEGDEQLIKQVLTNLLSNAFKYTEPGGAVRLEAAETGADQVRITVTDTGLGIAAKDLPHMFEPFVFSGSAMTRRRGGIGLGLSITKRLVELHGGTIAIASILGKGTTVTIILPKRQAATETTRAAQ
jgi:signal transduction histidine kinase